MIHLRNASLITGTEQKEWAEHLHEESGHIAHRVISMCQDMADGPIDFEVIVRAAERACPCQVALSWLLLAELSRTGARVGEDTFSLAQQVRLAARTES